MAAPLNTCTTIEQRGVVRFLWAKNMDAAKDIHKEMLPILCPQVVPTLASFIVTHNDRYAHDYRRSSCYKMAAPLNTCTTIEKRGVVRFLWAKKNMEAGSCRQPQTYVKPEAAITVFELLIMSGVPLETC
jgi:hypothetical protein